MYEVSLVQLETCLSCVAIGCKTAGQCLFRVGIYRDLQCSVFVSPCELPRLIVTVTAILAISARDLIRRNSANLACNWLLPDLLYLVASYRS